MLVNCEERGREVRNSRKIRGLPVRGWALGAAGVLCAAGMVGAVSVAQVAVAASPAVGAASSVTSPNSGDPEVTSAAARVTDLLADSDVAAMQSVRLVPQTAQAAAEVARVLGDDGYAYYFEARTHDGSSTEVLVTAVPQRLPVGSPAHATITAVRYVLTPEPAATMPPAVVAGGVGGVPFVPGQAATAASGVGTPVGSSASFGGVEVSLVGESGAVALMDVNFPATREAATSPSAPQSVRSQWRDGTDIAVTWAVPENAGGAVITGYTAEVSPGGQSCTTTITPSCVISGVPVLSGDQTTAYHVTVVARNVVGSSPASAMANVAAVSVAPTVSPTAAATSTATQMTDVTVMDAAASVPDANTANVDSTTAVMAPLAALPAETVVPTYDPFATSGSSTTTVDPYATADPYATTTTTTPYTTTAPYAATTTTSSTLASTGAGGALTWLAIGAMVVVAGSTLVVASRRIPQRVRYQAKHRARHTIGE